MQYICSTDMVACGCRKLARAHASVIMGASTSSTTSLAGRPAAANRAVASSTMLDDMACTAVAMGHASVHRVRPDSSATVSAYSGSGGASALPAAAAAAAAAAAVAGAGAGAGDGGVDPNAAARATTPGRARNMKPWSSTADGFSDSHASCDLRVDHRMSVAATLRALSPRATP